eukprot:CAMPEP_0174851766 /NCGR_PEP_ID=MMETSP1114-20130205/23839_1 /TAXON_ID=312471 /ORGANISM="Neobodo designis, Strain CCAP 1951/1" /LENGTH=63 /DNA_ID=CAMNT_0016086321 /DNA_START=57 /DNA_END=245 /DNA_ORIENTATION=+
MYTKNDLLAGVAAAARCGIYGSELVTASVGREADGVDEKDERGCENVRPTSQHRGAEEPRGEQ